MWRNAIKAQQYFGQYITWEVRAFLLKLGRFGSKLLTIVLNAGISIVLYRGGQTFHKSTEFRNSVAFHSFLGSPFPCFSVRIAESVS